MPVYVFVSWLAMFLTFFYQDIRFKIYLFIQI